MQLQVTLFDERGKYKPVSTLVEMPKKEVIAKNFKPYRDKGVQKICAKHYWTAKDIKKYFTQVKIRIYNEEKVKAENENRYNEIKRQKVIEALNKVLETKSKDRNSLAANGNLAKEISKKV